MPEFPEIGWDELPPPAQENEPNHQEAPHDDLNMQQEIVEKTRLMRISPGNLSFFKCRMILLMLSQLRT